MNIVIFTSNAVRHTYVANTLARAVPRALVISECKPKSPATSLAEDIAARHFRERDQVEQEFFGNNLVIETSTMPLIHKEVNLPIVYEQMKQFRPDAGVVFGSSIIREPLLSLVPAGRFINMHLGLSPYYRGSGTNFWPFVNEELEYVGATLLHIDAGIDTGDIIAHVRPEFEEEDTVHTVGCKTVQAATEQIIHCLDTLKKGDTLPRVRQWKADRERYYRNADFTQDVLRDYFRKMESGLVSRHVHGGKKTIRLV